MRLSSTRLPLRNSGNHSIGNALLQQQPDHEIDRELVLETIIFRMPQEDYERTFKTVLNWGRYGDLLAYDEGTEKVAISTPNQENSGDTH